MSNVRKCTQCAELHKNNNMRVILIKQTTAKYTILDLYLFTFTFIAVTLFIYILIHTRTQFNYACVCLCWYSSNSLRDLLQNRNEISVSTKEIEFR